MNWPVFDFVTACLVMGTGIGTDVAIATVLRARQLTTTRAIVYWILGVSATHTLFPMIGYLLTYFSIQVVPMLTPVVGVIACGFIAHFLWQEMKQLAVDGESSTGDDRQLMVSLGLILAVSWDALWSGPAKSAQVIGWPELLVWVSFLVVGMIVALCAISSWYLSQRFTSRSSAIPNSQCRRSKLAKVFSKAQGIALWLQYSIIAYFGLLALLRYTLGIHIVWWQILMIASLTVLVSLAAVRHHRLGRRLNAVS